MKFFSQAAWILGAELVFAQAQACPDQRINYGVLKERTRRTQMFVCDQNNLRDGRPIETKPGKWFDERKCRIEKTTCVDERTGCIMVWSTPGGNSLSSVSEIRNEFERAFPGTDPKDLVLLGSDVYLAGRFGLGEEIKYTNGVRLSELGDAPTRLTLPNGSAFADVRFERPLSSGECTDLDHSPAQPGSEIDSPSASEGNSARAI